MIPFALANLFASRNDPLRKPEEAVPALLAATTNPTANGSTHGRVTPPGALSMTTGPGALTPVMANQAAPKAKKKPPQPALSPLQEVEEASSPVAQVMADAAHTQGPELPPDALPDLSQYEAPAQPVDLSMGPPQEPQPALNLAGYEQGILSKLFDDSKTGVSPFQHLMRGLGAAGSQDPMQTLAMFQAQDREDQEYRDKRAAANRPKVTPLGDGVFSLVQFPDGTQRMVKNSEIAAHFDEQRDRKYQQDLEIARARAEGKQREQQDKTTAKAMLDNAPDKAQTEAAVSELTTLAGLLDKTDAATGPALGLVPKWGRDIITPEGADIQDRAERIIQASLRATLGAQFTEKEGKGFLERAYNPRLDEATNAARLRMMAKELQALQGSKEQAIEHMRKHGTLAGFAPVSSTEGAQGASSGGLPRISSDADYAQLPAGARYVSPDGKVRQKPGMVVPGLSERAAKYFQ